MGKIFSNMNGTVNKVILMGRLGDDVKLTYFSEGNCIGRFPLATEEVFTNRNTGEKTTHTEWHTIVVRNKVAEIFEKYLHKGDSVYIEGRLKTRQWQEDEVTRYATEIYVTEFQFLNNNRKEQNPSGKRQDNSQKNIEVNNDDHPF